MLDKSTNAQQFPNGWHMEHLSEVLSAVYSHTDRMIL